MTELKEFRLPDVGEGLTEADIVAWHVKAGDQVVIDEGLQPGNRVIVEGFQKLTPGTLVHPVPW